MLGFRSGSLSCAQLDRQGAEARRGLGQWSWAWGPSGRLGGDSLAFLELGLGCQLPAPARAQACTMCACAWCVSCVEKSVHTRERACACVRGVRAPLVHVRGGGGREWGELCSGREWPPFRSIRGSPVLWEGGAGAPVPGPALSLFSLIPGRQALGSDWLPCLPAAPRGSSELQVTAHPFPTAGLSWGPCSQNPPGCVCFARSA